MFKFIKATCKKVVDFFKSHIPLERRIILGLIALFPALVSWNISRKNEEQLNDYLSSYWVPRATSTESPKLKRIIADAVKLHFPEIPVRNEKFIRSVMRPTDDIEHIVSAAMCGGSEYNFALRVLEKGIR